MEDEERDPGDVRNRPSQSRSSSPTVRTLLREEPTIKKSAMHGREQLPEKFRIVNELLKLEMEKIVGVRDLNHDHVAPFRSIIPYEMAFRRRLEKEEKAWRELAANHPTDPVVRRTRTLLPWRWSYGVVMRLGPQQQFTLDRARSLVEGLRALIYFLDHDLAELVETYRKAQSHTIEKIPFSHLWYLYEPGQEIVHNTPKLQVCRILQVTGGRMSLVARRGDPKKTTRRTVSPLNIDCFSLDFDGKGIRPVPQRIILSPYEFAASVTSLAAFPLIYAEEGTEEDIIARGRKFKELIQVTHRRYRGLSLKESDSFSRYEEIDSDIIIDFELAFRNSEAKINTAAFGEGVIIKPTDEDEEETREPGFYYDDEELMQARWSAFVHETRLLEPSSPRSLGRDRLILLPHRVYAYVLLNRTWLPLDVDFIERIKLPEKGAPDGFEDLILPQGHKDVVRALVNTHSRVQGTLSPGDMGGPSHREFDIVKGKGKGLIILLHGAPGVGKTSTAECVAANTGRPLFPITCGDIGGNTAQEVEKNLERYFDLARKWGCVLLLDEADVFLSERIKGDIGQNSLVSVFSRVLEYYSGILILTTNRVGEFDEAIKSRVHCALYYPPLDKKNTLRVWKMNLDRLERQNNSPDRKLHIFYDPKKIMRFAKKHYKAGNHWNGRQIKNAFQTAVALADWDNLKENAPNGEETNSGPYLECKHFETVAAASAHFDRYLSEVRNSDQYRAKTHELRRDDYEHETSEYTKRKGPSTKAKKKRQTPKAPWPQISDSDSSDSETNSSSSESDIEQNVDQRKSRHKEKKSEKKDSGKKGSSKRTKEQKRAQSSSSSSSSSSGVEEE